MWSTILKSNQFVTSYIVISAPQRKRIMNTLVTYWPTPYELKKIHHSIFLKIFYIIHESYRTLHIWTFLICAFHKILLRAANQAEWNASSICTYIELGKWGMQIDWKERNTLKTLEEMNIAYVVIMHIFIFLPRYNTFRLCRV